MVSRAAARIPTGGGVGLLPAGRHAVGLCQVDGMALGTQGSGFAAGPACDQICDHDAVRRADTAEIA